MLEPLPTLRPATHNPHLGLRHTAPCMPATPAAVPAPCHPYRSCLTGAPARLQGITGGVEAFEEFQRKVSSGFICLHHHRGSGYGYLESAWRGVPNPGCLRMGAARAGCKLAGSLAAARLTYATG